MANKNGRNQRGLDSTLRTDLYYKYALRQPDLNKKSITRDNVGKTMREMFHEFCQNTSMHGFKFITRPESSRIDSILWCLMLICGIAFSIFFSNILWKTWESTPVVITIDSANCPIASKYSFPTVTVCSVNKVSKKALAELLNTKEGRRVKMEDMRSALDIITKTKGKREETERLGKILRKANITSKNQGYEKLVRKISPNCSEMFVSCTWEEDVEDCNSVFLQEATDDGYCCSFNSVIYYKNASITAEEQNKKLRKANADGIDSGLRIVMDAQIDDYNVTSYAYHGFRVSVQSTDTFVTTGSVGFLASPGSVVDVAVEGVVIDAKYYLKDVPSKRRNCGYRSDYPSKYYQDFAYTTTYCELECKVNMMLKNCKCIPYNLPVPSSIAVCDLLQYLCVANVTKYLSRNIDQCKCLDACVDIWYKTQITTGDYPNQVTRLPDLSHLSRFKDKNETQLREYAKANFVRLNAYYKSTTGMCYIRDIKTSWSDFISSAGGLLGLGFGFSILSAAEILYYIFFRGKHYLAVMRERQRNAAIIRVMPAVPRRSRAPAISNYVIKN